MRCRIAYYSVIKMSTRKEVQSHGFTWQEDILTKVYGLSPAELNSIPYTSEMDLPRTMNLRDGVNVSIKTSGSPNSVCMGDCGRVYDAVSSADPFHVTVVFYKQNDNTNTKHIQEVVEIDLTNSRHLLFGTVTREEIQRLSDMIRLIPQKRSPTKEEHTKIYAARNLLKQTGGLIHLDIKCNSQQSRLQCSFGRFKDFITSNTCRVKFRSSANIFRGHALLDHVVSGRRVFNCKKRVSDS